MEENDKFLIFEKWLLENGARFTKLELKDYGNEVRGCHSTEHIDTEENVVEIPLKCLITVEMGKDTEVGRRILQSDLDLDAPKHIFLMLYMLIDRKNPHSFFKPYYDILPRTLSNMPIFWTEEELSHLQGSFILTQIDERNLAIARDYNEICAIAPQMASIATLDEFKWARMAVCSRNFGIMVHGLRTAALVPYADMLNHYRPRETKWNYDDASDSFVVTALHPLTPGCEVFDSYGQKCNHRFLLNYGFSVEDNSEADGFNPNEVPILLRLSEEDVLFPQKLSMWRSDGSGYMRRVRVNLSECENTRLFFSLLRILVADAADIDGILQTQGTHAPFRFRGTYPQMLNSRNEAEALQLLTTVCDEYLARYKTSLEEDRLTLASGALPMYSNRRNAVLHVRGEKEILHTLRVLADCGQRLLRLSTEQEVIVRLEEIRSKEHFFVQQYCESLVHRIWRREKEARDLLLSVVDK